MPEEKTDLEEVKQKLDGILGWIQTQKETSQKDGKPWGWVTAALTAILAFVGLAFVAYDVWKKGREIAKLKHTLDVQEETKKRAEIDAKLADQATIQKARLDFAAIVDKRIVKTKEEILLIEKERKAAHDKIDAVTNWTDIDNLLK